MSLFSEIQECFPQGMEFPSLLSDFCEWIENNGYASIKANIELSPDREKTLLSYFDNGQIIKNDFGIFAHTGNGGIIGIWNKNENEKPIVHFGSEGDEWYILAPDFTSYLMSISINSDRQFRIWLEKVLNRSISKKDKIIVDKENKTLSRWLYNKFDIKIPFDEFDPDSKHNSESNSIDYKVILTSTPNNKTEFIKTARLLSKLSIGDLLKSSQNVPFIIYESQVFFRGRLDIRNFPEPDKSYLTELLNKYPTNIQIEYREYLGKNGKTDFKTLII